MHISVQHIELSYSWGQKNVLLCGTLNILESDSELTAHYLMMRWRRAMDKSQCGNALNHFVSFTRWYSLCCCCNLSFGFHVIADTWCQLSFAKISWAFFRFIGQMMQVIHSPQNFHTEHISSASMAGRFKS